MSSERIAEPALMQARAAAWRAEGERIAFVPTMGSLHAGHLSLLEEGRRRARRLVLSIFVNPLQFAAHEDLSRYPRDLDGDLAKAAPFAVDAVYVPTAAAMYPPGFQTHVEVGPLTGGLCGASRPGHFRGVATVVLKLLSAVRPDVALFGMKDYQQLQVVRRMVRDLDLGIEILGLPIVREADGLAMSSRNAYLVPEERARATALHQALLIAEARFAAGEREAAALVASARAPLDAAPGVRLDYLELCDAAELSTLEGKVTRPALLAVAAFVGTTRLIDNVVLSP